MKTLGIISGMGAFAGLRMADYLLQKSKDDGAKLDSDFPSFLLYNLPVVGMDEKGIIDHSHVKRQLVETLIKLGKWNCHYAVIACNSAYAFKDLASYFPGTLLNIIDEACDAVPKGVQRVGIISSASTRKSCLYQDALGDRGINYVLTNDEEQFFLDLAIKAVISGTQTKGDFHVVRNVLINLKQRGARMVIVGCTELPLVINSKHTKIPLIDAGQAVMNKALKLLR
jgi:aspartate racemase